MFILRAFVVCQFGPVPSLLSRRSKLPSATTVSVTASSATDPTKTASAAVSLSALTMSISPQTANLNAGQTQQFSAQVNQNTITGVTWTISPAVGTISAAGLYVAPALLGSQRTITVTATSVADPTKSLSSTVTLLSPVSVSPSSATLSQSQTQQFTATVTGLGNTAVTWSVSPALGSVTNAGLYSAPASIASSQIVSVIATSVSDTSKRAAATVTLNPPVSVTVSPVSASLQPGQSLVFTAAVSGASNNAVTWTSSPAGAGSITAAGVFSAPATISAQATVNVTATSVADPSKSASATVTLNPPVTITLSPSTVTLQSGQTQQFTPTVTGSANAAVTWSITPAGAGSINNTGLYTAPATIASAQTANLTATSVADASKSASATISLAPGSTTPIISTLSPPAGIGGSGVTISGSGFGAAQGTSTVSFNGLSAGTAASWTANTIVVTAPQAVTTGGVVVTVNNTGSNVVNFTVVPNISFLTPSSGVAGTSINILGTNFDASQGTSTVTFNGTNAVITSWANDSIRVTAPAGVTTGNVIVTANGLQSAGKPFAVPSSLISVTPANSEPGAQVTIAGTGFGTSQGSGTLWLGSTRAAIVSWSATQIVATVAVNSTSGTAQVQQAGVWSNPLPFSVASAVITSVSPTGAAPGAQVTITGSNFGATQGNGQLWLGTAYGVVQSWSNAQIVAQVAAGSTSGAAKVPQNGVWSGEVPFTVAGITLSGISPVSGAAGTQVTFSGSGFGTTQGTGMVWLGSAAGQVVSWSDTSVVATVGPIAVTGIARIQQGTWSKAFGFTVPQAGGGSATLTPSQLTMEVGDTSTLQALNAAGQPLAGLTWASSAPTVVSLSTANPPVLTALAVGRATITAGGASTDVTVLVGPLPVGTVLWSNVSADSIIPAVPSQTGVADVFAFSSSSVKAITADGTVAWTASFNSDPNYGCRMKADFQGGMIAQCNENSMYKLDGLTGQALPTYSNSSPLSGMAIHPDGTVFTIQRGPQVVSPLEPNAASTAVIGINPITGAQRFSIQIPGLPAPEGTAAMYFPPMIAGDGYAYVPYVNSEACGYRCLYNHLKLLRISSNGAYNVINVKDWRGGILDEIGVLLAMITNADTGILMSMWTENGTEFAVTTGTSISVVSAQTIGGQQGPLRPVLQAQDGSFVGTAWSNQGTGYMVAFEANGNIRWSVPNEEPDIATYGGGVMGRSGTLVDRNGRSIGQVSTPIQSWIGREYDLSSGVSSLNIPPNFPATASSWSQAGGNPSANGTAFALCPCLSQSATALLGPNSFRPGEGRSCYVL